MSNLPYAPKISNTGNTIHEFYIRGKRIEVQEGVFYILENPMIHKQQGNVFSSLTYPVENVGRIYKTLKKEKDFESESMLELKKTLICAILDVYENKSIIRILKDIGDDHLIYLLEVSNRIYSREFINTPLHNLFSKIKADTPRDTSGGVFFNTIKSYIPYLKRASFSLINSH